MADRIDIVCPCCNTKLTVDTETGDILAEERPRIDADKSFESALSAVQSGPQRRADAFDKAFDRTQRLDDLLSKKFEEAKKKAAKDDPAGKPRNPLDLD
jgi:hypothetical protein